MARNTTPSRCRCADLEERLELVEEMAKSYRKELDIQFRRIADLQAMLDSPRVGRFQRQQRKKYARKDH
jgi:hypothetical protein